MLAVTNLPHRAAAHLDLAWREMTRDHGGVQTDSFIRVITNEPHPLGNVAIINAAASLDSTREAVQPLLDVAVPAAVIHTGDASSAAEDFLVSAGFKRSPPLPAMAIRIDALTATELPRGCEWARVGPGDAEEFTEVLAKGFELPMGLARRLSPETLGIDPARDAKTQYFGVRESGRLVATSVLFLADGLAGVYSVAALPEVRGRGIGAFSTANALREAIPLGYRVGVLQSSQAGYAVYRRLGFADLRKLSMFVRLPV